jgi:TorA maturation chaperone TorD
MILKSKRLSKIMDKMRADTSSRITMYGLISRLMLIEVDSEFLDSIESDEAILDLFPNYKSWEKRVELDRKRLIDEYYNVDFASLFLMHLVPYESFYSRDDQTIESGGDNPVVELYNALDFRVDLTKARVVSADHIGIELEFMYMLCVAQSRAVDANDKEGLCELLKVQQGFLRDHLLEWSPMFLINMKRESRTPLYHDGAEMSLEFILGDFEYIAEQLALLGCSE